MNLLGSRACCRDTRILHNCRSGVTRLLLSNPNFDWLQEKSGSGGYVGRHVTFPSLKYNEKLKLDQSSEISCAIYIRDVFRREGPKGARKSNFSTIFTNDARYANTWKPYPLSNLRPGLTRIRFTPSVQPHLRTHLKRKFANRNAQNKRFKITNPLNDKNHVPKWKMVAKLSSTITTFTHYTSCEDSVASRGYIFSSSTTSKPAQRWSFLLLRREPHNAATPDLVKYRI